MGIFVENNVLGQMLILVYTYIDLGVAGKGNMDFLVLFINMELLQEQDKS